MWTFDHKYMILHSMCVAYLHLLETKIMEFQQELTVTLF